MRLARTLGLAAGLAAVGSMTLAGGASAKPIEHTKFHEDFSETIEDFCDVDGLAVQHEGAADGRLLVNPHGPEGLIYFQANVKFTGVFTNPANGNTVTEVGNAVDKDLRVTDNGDGTLTILVLSTGNIAAFGPDGKALARNPGQVRFSFMVDKDTQDPEPPVPSKLQRLRNGFDAVGDVLGLAILAGIPIVIVTVAVLNAVARDWLIEHVSFWDELVGYIDRLPTVF